MTTVDQPRQAAIDATLDLIAERGVPGLTTDAVAERAGISKATMYRRWRSKEELMLDAVASLVGEIAVPDTGSFAGDVRALLRNAVKLYADDRPSQLFPHLVGEMARNPALADAVRSGFLAQRRSVLCAIVERARARGELRPDVDTELCLDLFAGVIYYRFLITGGPLTRRVADDLADVIVRGVAT
jgi:AcrR family transcriptional regulator